MTARLQAIGRRVSAGLRWDQPVSVQADTPNPYLTLSAVGESGPDLSSGPTDPRRPALADGLAPNTVGLAAGPTRLCGTCVTLGRRDPVTLEWRHVAIGFDHPFDPDALRRIKAERDAPIVTESELRLLDGNR